MNPCPCGNAGDGARACCCAAADIAKYRARLSGPMRDRVDMHVPVGALALAALASGGEGECSASIRERVELARARQLARYAESGEAAVNAHVPARLLQSLGGITAEARSLLTGRRSGWDSRRAAIIACCASRARSRISMRRVASRRRTSRRRCGIELRERARRRSESASTPVASPSSAAAPSPRPASSPRVRATPRSSSQPECCSRRAPAACRCPSPRTCSTGARRSRIR